MPKKLLNNFDKLFFGISSHSVHARTRALADTFQKGALFVSEPQLIIAIAFLGAGFSRWRQKSAFDFHAVLYLSWMSCNMHLSSLIILRRFMQKNHTIRALRIIGMSILFIMMCVAITPTIQWKWTVYLLRGNRCLTGNYCLDLTMTVNEHLENLSGPKQISPQGIIAYLLLAFSNLWQGLLLYKRPQEIWLGFKRMILKSIENEELRDLFIKQTRKRRLRIRQRFRIGIYLYVLAIFDVYGSFAFSLFVVLTHLSWGTFQLFRMRFAPLPDCVKTHLNEWKYGQILAMILLLSPLYSIITFYIEWSLSSQTRPSSTSSLTSTILPRQTLEDQKRDKLQQEIYKLAQFKFTLGTLCVLSVGNVIGFFTLFAYNVSPMPDTSQKYLNISWKTSCFGLLPVVIATVCGLVVICIFSIASALFGARF